MDKRAAIVLAILAVLAVIFVAIHLSGDGRDIEPRQFEGITDLARIEIMPPPGREGPELIVLERRSADQWWITRPIEAPMSRRRAEEFETTFARTLSTDDLRIAIDLAESYDLDDQSSVRVALFSSEEERPTREFLVGKEMEVPQTGVRRTFVTTPESDVIYRARAAFGDLVRLSTDELRDPWVFTIGDEGIQGLRLLHDDGHQVELEYRDGQWHQTAGPTAHLGVDQQRTRRLVSAVSRLRAVEFFEAEAADSEHEQSTVVVEVATGRGERRLEVRRRGGDEGPAFRIKIDDGPEIYGVEPEIGQLLTSRLGDIRSRRIIEGGSAAVSKIELAGSDAVSLVRRDGDWKMEHPDEGPAAEDAAQSLAQYLGALQVERWVDDISADEAGVDDEQSHRIAITVDGEPTFLDVGKHVDEHSDARYGRYSEVQGLFILSEESVNRLSADANDFRTK